MPRLYELDTLDLIRMSCGSCGHIRDLPARFMALSCDEELSVQTIERRLRCRICNHKGSNKVEVLYGKVDMNGDYFVYQESAGKL